MKLVLKAFTFLLPWPIRRIALQSWFGYRIHPTARIGLAWIFPGKLIMGAYSKIDHFNVAIHLDRIEMGKDSFIGRSNWITGLSTSSSAPYFKHQNDRRAELILHDSANITKNHHFDCTNSIIIGRFATIAGYNSQFLTHSVDLYENRQDSAPINIGDYAFVGSNVVILSGSSLPSYSVLGAKSLLKKKYSDEWTLYSGVPACPVKQIPRDAKYFSRNEGFIL